MGLFVGRESELAALESEGGKDAARLVLLYGRRRIGKTALLLELARRRKGIYLLARQENMQEQLKGFSAAIAEHAGDESLRQSPFQNYDALFSYIASRIPEGTPVIFDEFPYAVEADPSLPSVLQDHWDRTLQHRRTFIVLCGSLIRMMERLAGYKSPIYGRRTEQMLLEPLPFPAARKLMGQVSAEKAVETYSILGGTPAYLQLFDHSKSIEHNVVSKMLQKTSFLNQDAQFILREELDEPRNYFSILNSISKGNTQLGTIINDTGLGRGVVSKYLSVLSDLRVIRREVPITEGANSRKGVYTLSDPYFRFWFRFVFSNSQYLESAGGQKTYSERIAPQLPAHTGKVFEDISMGWLQKKLPGYAFGRWWLDAKEIDIAGISEKGSNALIEAKWSALNEQAARNILLALSEKAPAFCGNSPGPTRLGIIAKRLPAKLALRKEGFLAYDLDDIAGK